MGEPLLNWDAVSTALTILNDPAGMGIGARHITVSTVGVLPGIEALARRPEQFRLAISVHAPSDELRRSLMPISLKYPLSAVTEAAAAFHRRVTFEYVLLAGVNDQPGHSAQLARLARTCSAFVNLIPLHPGGAGEYRPTSAERMAEFAREIQRAGVAVAVRKSRGLDIAAACGQLRAERIRRRRPVGSEENSHIDKARGVGTRID
jgi:23S rRNA (adenine2503-C2)-methyltransferase